MYNPVLLCALLLIAVKVSQSDAALHIISSEEDDMDVIPPASPKGQEFPINARAVGAIQAGLGILKHQQKLSDCYRKCGGNTNAWWYQTCASTYCDVKWGKIKNKRTKWLE